MKVPHKKKNLSNPRNVEMKGCLPLYNTNERKIIVVVMR